MDANANRHLKYSLGHMLPPVAVYMGYFFMLVGIPSIIFGNPFLGGGIILLGMLISFTYRGVVIDVQRREVLTYTSIIWIKRDAVVKSVDDYSIITVNHSSMSYRSYSLSNRSAVFTSHYYTIFLSKDTSKRGIPVATFKKRETALEEAEKLEKLFGLRLQATRM